MTKKKEIEERMTRANQLNEPAPTWVIERLREDIQDVIDMVFPPFLRKNPEEAMKRRKKLIENGMALSY